MKTKTHIIREEKKAKLIKRAKELVDGLTPGDIVYIVGRIKDNEPDENEYKIHEVTIDEINIDNIQSIEELMIKTHREPEFIYDETQLKSMYRFVSLGTYEDFKEQMSKDILYLKLGRNNEYTIFKTKQEASKRRIELLEAQKNYLQSEQIRIEQEIKEEKEKLK